MKNKFNFRLLKVLLEKQMSEKLAVFRSNKKQFDIVGLILKIFLATTLVVVFVAFFSQFLDIYLNIKINGVEDKFARQFELLTVFYTIVVLALMCNGISNINHNIFKNDDIKIFAAMPIDGNTLFLSKMIGIYVQQLIVALFTILPINFTFAVATSQSMWYIGFTILMCFLLPLISISLAALLALPVHYVRSFFKHKFVLSFVTVTIFTAGFFLFYSQILTAIKQMLLGDGLKYFFNESVMDFLIAITKSVYPANWLASLMLQKDVLTSGLCLLALLVACAIVAVVTTRKMLTNAMQQKISGDQAYIMLRRPSPRKKSIFSALIGKEFNSIFRTSGYAFGYFSIAIIMPLMVYFCMTIGVSLVQSLIFIDCQFELAIFLTIIFGVLTNTFCATNISREGMMFYCVKAMPISYKQVMFSKVTFCFMVTALTNLVSSTVLHLTGFLSVWEWIFVFAIGAALGFAQICFATRKDFNNPRFSTEEDGEIKESNNTISTIIVAGLLVAAFIGGVIVYFTMYRGLILGKESGVLPWIFVGVISIVLSLVSYRYLLFRLSNKYFEFSEGI